MEKSWTSIFRCDGILSFQNRMCTKWPKTEKEIPSHRSEYIVHPDNTKMYRNLRENYWWNGMKGDWKFRFQVFDISTSKAEHYRSVGLLYYQYSSGSGKTFHGLRGWLAPNKNHHDAIWVIVDRLMKSSHFSLLRWQNLLRNLPDCIYKR